MPTVACLQEKIYSVFCEICQSNDPKTTTYQQVVLKMSDIETELLRQKGELGENDELDGDQKAQFGICFASSEV